MMLSPTDYQAERDRDELVVVRRQRKSLAIVQLGLSATPVSSGALARCGVFSPNDAISPGPQHIRRNSRRQAHRGPPLRTKAVRPRGRTRHRECDSSSRLLITNVLAGTEDIAASTATDSSLLGSVATPNVCTDRT